MSIDQSYKKYSVDRRQNISNCTWIGSNSIFHLLISALGRDLRSSSTTNFGIQSVGSMNRPRIRPQSTKEKQVLLLPRNSGDSHLHLAQSLGRLGWRRAWVLGSLLSRRRGRGPRA